MHRHVHYKANVGELLIHDYVLLCTHIGHNPASALRAFPRQNEVFGVLQNLGHFSMSAMASLEALDQPLSA